MDLIFKAMADPARRDILEALREQDGQSLSALTERFEMTRFGVMKHLAMLEEAGMVTTIKRGRFKYHYLNAVPLQEALDHWIVPFVKPAARKLSDLKSQLESASAITTIELFIAASASALRDHLTGPDSDQNWRGTDSTDGTLSTDDDGHTLALRLAPVGPHTHVILAVPDRRKDAWLRQLSALKTFAETGMHVDFSTPQPPHPKETLA
ncbi:MAG: metalloregulator ArsR/SmtB family transcription factor [Pseudomonadota bacterium]